MKFVLSRMKSIGDLGVRDSCVRFPLIEISFVLSGSRPNALNVCLYHDYRLRQKQGGEQRAEYFCSLHPDPPFLPHILCMIQYLSLAIKYPTFMSGSSYRPNP